VVEQQAQPVMAEVAVSPGDPVRVLDLQVEVLGRSAGRQPSAAQPRMPSVMVVRPVSSSWRARSRTCRSRGMRWSVRTPDHVGGGSLGYGGGEDRRSEGHAERSCWSGTGRRRRGLARGEVLVRAGDTVLGTHRQLETAGQVLWPRSGTRQVERGGELPGAVTEEEPNGVTAGRRGSWQVVRSALTSAGELAHG
jgi:hypothetical protein